MSVEGRLIVSVIGRKGGAGKTTTAFNLAGAIEEHGRAVCLLDLDPQESLSRLFEPGDGAAHVKAWGAIAERHSVRGDTTQWLAGALPQEGLVIIDTPPHLGAIMDAAIACADRVVLPTRLIRPDIDSLRDTLGRCPGAPLIVPNAVMVRNGTHRDMLTELRRVYGTLVWGKEIPQSVVVEEALNAGQPVARYRRRSAPAAAYRALATEVLGA